MTRVSGSLTRMSRHEQVPEGLEQTAAFGRVRRAALRADSAERDLWEAVSDALAAGVTAAYLAAHVDRLSLATVKRHRLGKGQRRGVRPVVVDSKG